MTKKAPSYIVAIRYPSTLHHGMRFVKRIVERKEGEVAFNTTKDIALAERFNSIDSHHVCMMVEDADVEDVNSCFNGNQYREPSILKVVS